jgi:tRNA A-37 threonylcarbamoyl transferase component Bud32
MAPQDFQERSLDFQRRLDGACQEYERRWQHGESPRLNDYLQDFAEQERGSLLKELLLIEHHYRTDSQGGRLSVEELCALHSHLIPDLASAWGWFASQNELVTTALARPQATSAPSSRIASTRADTTHRKGSSGLHIRCPHCSNPVELLGDISVDSIICQTCGSVFSLVNESEHTQQAPMLKRIGRFEIVGRLGVGGFGTVWKARDPELERAVAIKIPRKGQLDDKQIESFVKEARTVAQLNHPNILPVYEVGKDADSVFIVSKLVRGVSFSDWLSDAKPGFRQIVEILIPICQALQHAHEKGVVHRDLKPSNIMIDETEQPIVMDFGLAKRDNLEIAMTLDGQILGTPAYMSPEQASGHSNWTDRRMDIYALGVILFRLLTGELPFRGNAQMQIHKRLTQDAPDPRTLNRFIPQDLATICLKCLERDPNGRYASAQQITAEFHRYLRGEPVLARPISRLEKMIRWARRKPAAAAALALLLVLAVGGTSAAIVIEGLRERQSELLVEKDNLITRMGNEGTALTVQLAALQDQLDIWEGQANPWKIWPPRAVEPPQKQLLEGLLPNGISLAEQWRQGSDPVQASCGHFALATIYDELSMPDLAVTEYSRAYRIIRDFCANESCPERFRLALADCCIQLARLSVEQDRNQAAIYLQEAEQSLEKVDGAYLAQSRAELLSVEFEQAILPGFEGASESLTAVNQIRTDMPRIAPSDARQFYELICQLAHRTPHLALSRPPQQAAASTTTPDVLKQGHP